MKTTFLKLTLLFAVILYSCGSDDGISTPPDPTSGDISGSVNLYDEGVTQVDPSGMTVRIEGLSAQATTGNDGSFSLDDIPFGTYTLVYEKAGYGTFKKFDIEHNSIATFIADAPSLGQQSSTQITDLTSGTAMNGDILIGGTTDPVANNSNPRIVRVFLSDQGTVSATNFRVALDATQVQITPFEYSFSQSDLLGYGFQSGQTVYVRAYGDSFFGNNYDDPILNRMIYPNLNATSAPAVSFVVP